LSMVELTLSGAAFLFFGWWYNSIID